MGLYDVIMLVILGGAVFFGFWKGLAWQIASLAAIVVSYIVSVNFRDPLSRFIQTEEPWNRIGAMLILFLGTSIVIWTIYSRVKARIKKMEMGGFDRQAGALLGAFKGVLLCMVVTMFSVTLLGEKAHDAIHTSKFGPYVETAIIKLPSIVPAEIETHLAKYIDDYKARIGHDGKPIDSYPNAATLPGTVTSTYSANGVMVQQPGQLPPQQGGFQGQPTGYQGQPGNYQAQWNYQQPTAPANNGQAQNYNYGQQPQQQPTQYTQPPQQWTQQQQQQYQQQQQNPNYNNQANTQYQQPQQPATQAGTNYGTGGQQIQQPNTNTNSPFGPSQDFIDGFKQLGNEAIGKVKEAGQQVIQEEAKRRWENTFNGGGQR